MKRERDDECWDGGHAFGKKLALEIALQIQTRESTLVQNLRKEIAAYQKDLQQFNACASGSLCDPKVYCLYCYHVKKEITTEDDAERQYQPSEECLYCKEFVPCEEYCVNIRGMDADICPQCANKNI